MVESGIEIEEVRRGTASLEEAFLKLMAEDQ
jgi:tmRNA-binding protein